MRITPPTLALSAMFAIVSSVGHSQPTLEPVAPRSIELTQAGDAALVDPNKVNLATDDYEAALAVSPQNRAALIGLAHAASAQGLQGKAIHYYNELLTLNPNDVAALSGQGEAMVAKGALVKANENLAKIQALCVTSCPEQVALRSAIARGSAPQAVSAAQIKINPILTETEHTN